MPEWLGRGLQNLVQEFDSPSDLQKVCRASGGIGRRSGLKIRGPLPDMRVRVPPCPRKSSTSSFCIGGEKMWKNAYPCRCKSCRRRKTVRKHPREYFRKPPSCCCGGQLSVDTFRLERENKKYKCSCTGLPFPHRKGSKWCNHYTGCYTEDDEDSHPFLSMKIYY